MNYRRPSFLTIAISVICLLFFVSCGGGSGGSGDPSSTPSQSNTRYLNGRYSFVRFSSDHGGADTGASFASGIGYADIDENGGITSTITAVAYGQSVAGAFGTGTSSNTYTLTSDGTLTFGDGTPGYVSADDETAIYTEKIPEDSDQETGISVALKAGSGLSATNLDGRYSLVRFSSDHGGEDSGAVFTSGVGYVDFDGAGNVSITITSIVNGQPSGEAFDLGTSSGTYTVDPDGEVTLSDGSDGYVSANGNIVTWSDKIPEDSNEGTGITIALKEGSGLSNASLNGRYSCVRFSSDHGGADAGAEFTSGIGYIEFDGMGNFTETITATANGQSSGEAFAAGTSSGTYSVAPNGEVTFNDGTTGYVSSDGGIFIWANTIQDSYEETGLAMGLKTN